MPNILLIFSSAAAAEFLVAGVPAAARAANAIAALQERDDVTRCSITCPCDWVPSDLVRTECRRLAPDLAVDFIRRPGGDDDIVADGETFVAEVARSRQQGRDAALPALLHAWRRSLTHSRRSCRNDRAALSLLRGASRQILRSTGKAGDGLVSRYVNRPMSRTLSAVALRMPFIKPVHATAGTAALGVAMFLALISGGRSGLVAGALLFQAASIFDGVDGEIARATRRTSDRGAMLDSVIDAMTNIAFVAGVSLNIAAAGDALGAWAGVVALTVLASGLSIMGRQARALGQPVNFDVVKVRLRQAGPPSWLREALIHVTMRDFFAAACATMVLAGLAREALIAFAVVASGWFIVTVRTLRWPAMTRPRPIHTLRGLLTGTAPSGRC